MLRMIFLLTFLQLNIPMMTLQHTILIRETLYVGKLITNMPEYSHNIKQLAIGSYILMLKVHLDHKGLKLTLLLLNSVGTIKPI